MKIAFLSIFINLGLSVKKTKLSFLNGIHGELVLLVLIFVAKIKFVFLGYKICCEKRNFDLSVKKLLLMRLKLGLHGIHQVF